MLLAIAGAQHRLDQEKNLPYFWGEDHLCSTQALKYTLHLRVYHRQSCKSLNINVSNPSDAKYSAA